MNRKLDDFLFYFPRIVMALIGAAAFAFGAWFSQLYYLYLNCIVLPISWAIAAYGIECASQAVKAYRCSLYPPTGERDGAPYLTDLYLLEKGNRNDRGNHEPG